MKRSTLTLFACSTLLGLHAQQAVQHVPMLDKLDNLPLSPSWQPTQHPARLNGRPKAASTIELGKAANMFTALLSGQNQVSYEPAINSVVFIHRQDPAEHGNQGGSGTLRFDRSTNGGSTWTNDVLLTPAMFNGTAGDATGSRYPSVALWNPSGNTDPANAFVVGNGPALSGTTGSWGLLFRASAKLDGSGATDTYVDQYGDLTSFHPYAVSQAGDHVWSMSTRYVAASDAANYESFQVNKGTFNGGTNSFDWTIANTITPNYELTPDGTKFYSAHNMAWSPDGQTGYAVCMGKTTQNLPTGPYPIIWKTTDGGDTWSLLPEHDFAQEPEMIQWITAANGSGQPRPYFSDFDCVVDGSGKLHIFSEVLSGFSSSPDSSTFIFASVLTQFLFHVATSDGVNWDVKKVADVLNEDYEYPSPQPPGPSQSNRPQATRTPSGDRVFFSWNSSGPNEVQNFLPDIYAVGHNPSSGQYTNVKNLTAGTDAGEFSYFHTVAPVCISGGSDPNYELPIVYMEPGGDDLSPATFFYLKGVGFNEAEFFVSINETDINERVTVFPNPGNGAYWINLNELGAVDLQVTDLTGRLITRTRVNTNQHVLDLHGEPAGMYLLTIDSGSARTTRKLVKE